MIYVLQVQYMIDDIWYIKKMALLLCPAEKNPEKSEPSLGQAEQPFYD